MNIETLQELLTGDYSKAKDAIIQASGDSKAEDYLKQYEVSGHAVLDTTQRLDKPIMRDVKNEKGEVIGEEIERYEKVARIAIPFQKMIAQRAAAFLCANPIQLDATAENDSEESLLEAVQKTWDDNKLDFKSMDLAEKMMSETEVAELWYTEAIAPDEDYWGESGVKGQFKLRCLTLAKSLGDDLHPLFDVTGNLIAFGRGYTVRNGDKSEQHFDIYTDANIYKGVQNESGWNVASEPNLIKKIPIIYYTQPAPEWADVQTMIDRLETKVSNHADTNDYFDSPILFVEGEIAGMAEKGQGGKVLFGTNGAKASYLAWNNAPESTKMEIENLIKFIHLCTDTPEMSADTLKAGNAPSGYAMEIAFMPAHLKAARKAGIFGEGVQRRINYLKTALSTIDITLKKGTSLTIKPVFDFFMPKDLEGLTNILSTAVTTGILSKKTAVAKLQLAEDVEAELKELEGEQNAASALDREQNAA